ncbi:MAG: BatA domain-containing protein [Planctomycetota bacterium]
MPAGIFETPAVLGALFLIPVLLWLARRRAPRRLRVGSLYIWERLAETGALPEAARRRRIPPRTVFQIAIWSVLIVAAAGPLFGGGRGEYWRIVMDTSASLGVKDGRWERQMASLRRFASDAAPSDRFELIRAARGGGTVLRDASAAEVIRAAGRFAPEPLPDDIGDFVAAAVGARGGAGVVVFSDGTRPLAPAYEGNGMVVVYSGHPVENVGIASAVVMSGEGLFVALRHELGAPRRVTVEVSVAGRVLGEEAADLPAGEGERAVWIPIPEVAAAPLEIRLAPGDIFPVDDSVRLVRVPAAGTVAVRGGRSSDVEKALLAVNPGIRIVQEPAGAEPVDAELALYIRAAPSVESRAVVVIVDPPDGVWNGVRTAGRNPAGPVAVREPGDSLLRGVRLEGLAAPGSAHMVFSPAARVLASVGAWPVLARMETPAQKIVVMGFDPAAASWRQSVSFPIFWANVMAEAPGRGEVWQARGLLDSAEGRLSGRRRDMPPGRMSGRGHAGETARAGWWWIAVACVLLLLAEWGWGRPAGTGSGRTP